MEVGLLDERQAGQGHERSSLVRPIHYLFFPREIHGKYASSSIADGSLE